ncbi:hypothetical protein BGZ54_003525, partial [Gamsiella multidivaricata]
MDIAAYSAKSSLLYYYINESIFTDDFATAWDPKPEVRQPVEDSMSVPIDDLDSLEEMPLDVFENRDGNPMDDIDGGSVTLTSYPRV